MAEIQKLNGQNCWLNHKGNYVPVSVISKKEKSRDKAVERVIKQALNYNKKLKDLKLKFRELIQGHLNSITKDKGESYKGNATLYNYARTMKVEINISERMSFDEGLQVAKQLIDKYIKSLIKDADQNLINLVTDAFEVDKKGKLNVQRILSLRSYKIKHPDWQEAIKLIDDSLVVDSTKQYMKFYVKDENENWQSISLNFSAL